MTRVAAVWLILKRQLRFNTLAVGWLPKLYRVDGFIEARYKVLGLLFLSCSIPFYFYCTIPCCISRKRKPRQVGSVTDNVMARTTRGDGRGQKWRLAPPTEHGRVLLHAMLHHVLCAHLLWPLVHRAQMWRVPRNSADSPSNRNVGQWSVQPSGNVANYVRSEISLKTDIQPNLFLSRKHEWFS